MFCLLKFANELTGCRGMIEAEMYLAIVYAKYGFNEIKSHSGRVT